MKDQYDLNRFIEAQQNKYTDAFNEIRNGKKDTHWMWFVFPQISGLGFSEMSKKYAIKDLTEAQLYLQHPILGERLIRISKLLLSIHGKTALEIFGSPDHLKLKSSMTLFSSLQKTDMVFLQIIHQYFNGEKDIKTLSLIS